MAHDALTVRGGLALMCFALPMRDARTRRRVDPSGKSAAFDDDLRQNSFDATDFLRRTLLGVVSSPPDLQVQRRTATGPTVPRLGHNFSPGALRSMVPGNRGDRMPPCQAHNDGA